MRPPVIRFEIIWDVNVVLKYLKSFYPHKDIPLSHLTYKFVMLLALASKQRVQTLHVFECSDIKIFVHVVFIPIRKLVKNTNWKKPKLALYLNHYTDKSLFVVETLLVYIDITKELRRSCNQLYKTP